MTKLFVHYMMEMSRRSRPSMPSRPAATTTIQAALAGIGGHGGSGSLWPSGNEVKGTIIDTPDRALRPDPDLPQRWEQPRGGQPDHQLRQEHRRLRRALYQGDQDGRAELHDRQPPRMTVCATSPEPELPRNDEQAQRHDQPSRQAHCQHHSAPRPDHEGKEHCPRQWQHREGRRGAPRPDPALPRGDGQSRSERHNKTRRGQDMGQQLEIHARAALVLVTGSRAFHDILDEPGTPGWFREAAEMGYGMVLQQAGPGRIADAVDEAAATANGEEWYLRAEPYRSGLRRLWEREHQKLQREPRPSPPRIPNDDEVRRFAHQVVEYMRRCMLADQYRENQYYPPCWGHDGYEQRPRSRSPRGRTPSSSRSQSPCRQSRNGGDVSEQDLEDYGESDAAAWVQKKWLLKPKRAKEVYQTSKMIWRSARPQHRTATVRQLRPEAPRSLLSRRCPNAPWRRDGSSGREEEMVTVDLEDDEDEEGGAGTEAGTTGQDTTHSAEADRHRRRPMVDTFGAGCLWRITGGSG